MPTLIFNADDYGLSPAVSRGILAAARGVVRSTTVMANFVTDHEAQVLRESGLSCGAHLNVSTGMPLTDYPQVLRNSDGGFDKQRALDPLMWDAEQHRAAAVREWTAQLAHLRALGLPVGHLDSHHHTHMVGVLFADAARFAHEHELPLRCRHLMRTQLRRVGVRSPDDLLEGYFGAGSVARDALLHVLTHAQGEVIEVMCHPGYVDDTLRSRSGYLEERERELEVLGDPELVEELESMGYTLASYAVLG